MLNEMEAYTGLPEETKQTLLALSILTARIGALPKADFDDLFDLLKAWRANQDPEERRSIQRAMEEILAQTPIHAKALPLPRDEQGLAPGLKAWAHHVGQKIADLRRGAGLSQQQLADKSGLTQSHISRLENAEHSPTNFTLEKIAKALQVDVGQIDPCAD